MITPRMIYKTKLFTRYNNIIEYCIIAQMFGSRAVTYAIKLKQLNFCIDMGKVVITFLELKKIAVFYLHIPSRIIRFGGVFFCT